jgi:hypothetical protein
LHQNALDLRLGFARLRLQQQRGKKQELHQDDTQKLTIMATSLK